MRLAHVLAALLCACSPVAGTGDASAPTDAAEASTPLDAPGDTQPEASTPEAAAPDVVARDALRCATDMDGDGYIWVECGGDDCDDRNARVHPGQLPTCEVGAGDSDCNGTLDEREPSEREARCRIECRAMMGRDCSGFATVACTETTRVLSCRSCTGTGASEQCRCWRSGESSSRTCVP